MIKRVGAYEIDYYEDSRWAKIVYHYNDSVKSEIHVRGLQDLFDLEYAVQCIKRDAVTNNARAPEKS